MHKRPNEISGGQMQRMAIARALLNDPDILLADKPADALDSKISVQIMELLKEIAKDKLVIVVTHNPELAERYPTRLVLLAGLIPSRFAARKNPVMSLTVVCDPVWKSTDKSKFIAPTQAVV